ncbi:FixH family protein [Streptomyces sp. SP17BM10]|uniref:copper resistance CopC/CopD family protein n=1 Tax=Streptomyces sp. SP17BM10 TaxID=3002530 RepID=UPI002E791287|nr:FixH family protein [Streptomyces sp. SP17BM10]MEE1785724.1 FixH family protein [Streptomyces sp. SP17BM10]
MEKASHRRIAAPRTAPRRVAGLLGLLGALFALMLAGAGPASAHATLESTDPHQNSVLATAPQAVTLTFSEAVSLSGDSVRVLDPAGKAVDTGNPGHADGRTDTARVGLGPDLANGTYTVAWRAVSEDSHPVGGAFTFSIGAPSDTSVSATALQGAKADGVVAALYGAGRTVAYVAFALLAGAAAFTLICWPAGVARRPVQRLLMTGWVALLVSTVTVLMLRGPYERGSGIGQALDLSLVRATLDERIGTALAARLLLLAASGVFLSLLVGQLGQPAPEDEREDGHEDDHEAAELRELERRAAGRPQREARIGLGVGGLVLAVALAATWVGADHASVGIQVWLALPLGLLHLIAMAFWLGGLASLLVALREGVGAEVVDRFSKVAFGSVVVLVVTGGYQSWRGLGSWGALTGTEYGRLLLVKTGCVVVMLGVAWLSRSWLARLRSAPDEAAEVEPAELPEPVTVAAHSEDPVRQAQLERQRAAVASAGRERGLTPTRAGLRRSVLVEAAVAVAVLVVTTMLTNSPPGRVAGEVKAGGAAAPAAGVAAPAQTQPGRTVELKLPYDTKGRTPNAKGTATVTVNPAGTGSNEVKLALDGADGKPVDVPEVQLAFTLPDRDLGPLPVPLTPGGTGRWTGTAQLPLAGDWVVSVQIRSSDIDQTTPTKSLKIG